jgi:mono/diheme cytochrome c family protein
MKKLVLRVIALTLAAGLGSLAQAQEAKSDLAAAGRDFALKVCANCHVVAKDQKVAPLLKPPAPSFAALAARSDISEESLRKLLSSPHGDLGRHGKMPNPQLGDYQIDKIVAYFMSLKQGVGGK